MLVCLELEYKLEGSRHFIPKELGNSPRRTTLEFKQELMETAGIWLGRLAFGSV